MEAPGLRYSPFCEIFGIDDALIGAGVSLLGSTLGFIGQNNTNAQNSRNAAMQVAANEDMQRAGFNYDQMMAGYQTGTNQSFLNQAQDFNRESAQRAMDFSSSEASTARQFNDVEMQKQMGFADVMSSTAYQRMTNDMRAAGLNPILGLGSGGASTPSVGMASSPSPSGVSASSPSASVGLSSGPGGGGAAMATAGNSLAAGINTGLSAMSTLSDIKRMMTDVPLTEARTAQTKQETVNLKTQQEKTTAETALVKASQDLTEGQIRNLPAQQQRDLAIAVANQAAAGDSNARALGQRLKNQFFIDNGVPTEALTGAAPSAMGVGTGSLGSVIYLQRNLEKMGKNLGDLVGEVGSSALDFAKGRGVTPPVDRRITPGFQPRWGSMRPVPGTPIE